MQQQKYILVIVESDLEHPQKEFPFQSTNVLESLDQSKMSRRSCHEFSFSNQKQMLDRMGRMDFEDSSVVGQEQAIAFTDQSLTANNQGMRYVGLLQGLFICLTVRLIRLKREAFQSLMEWQEGSLSMCRLAMSSIAQERIIPYISEEILRTTRLAGSPNSKDRASPKSRRMNTGSAQKTAFRFGFKMQKIYSMRCVRTGFDSLKGQRDQPTICSLGQIKKVESSGSLNFPCKGPRKPVLEVKIICKYARKISLARSFLKLKQVYRCGRLQRVEQITRNHQTHLSRHIFAQYSLQLDFQKALDCLDRAISCTLNKSIYKRVVQSFYKIKTFNGFTGQRLNAVIKLQQTWNKKQIKNIFGGFMKLRQCRSHNQIYKASNLHETLGNFSLLMSTQAKSMIYDDFLKDDNSDFYPRRTLDRSKARFPSVAIKADSEATRQRCVHERPLPPVVIFDRSRINRLQPIQPDRIQNIDWDEEQDD